MRLILRHVICALLVGSFFAVGCGVGGTKGKLAASFRNSVKSRLKDPNSASFEGLSVREVTLPNIKTLGSGAPGYFVYAKVRATNSYGGVVPELFQGFYAQDGSPIYVGNVENTPIGRSLNDVDEYERWLDVYLPE